MTINPFILHGEEITPVRKLLYLKALAGGAPLSEYTETGNPVSFNTNVAKPMSVVAAFSPVQAGSGDPSPDNVRPITGFTGANVYLSATGADDPDKQTFAVTFPEEAGTAYGGTLDLSTGVLTVEWSGFSKKWSDGENATDMGNSITRKQYPMVDNLQTGPTKNTCNIAPYQASENANIHFYYSGSGATKRNCRMFLPSDTDGDTEITVITNLSVPLVYQLTPTEILSLVGDNVVWSDLNGDLSVTYKKRG